MDLSIRPCELFTKLNPVTKEYFEKTQLKFDGERVILTNSQCFNNPRYATFVARLSDPNDTAFFDMNVIAVNDTNTIEKTIFVNSNITDLNARFADLDIHKNNFKKLGHVYSQKWLTVLYAMNYLGNELGMIYDAACVARPY